MSHPEHESVWKLLDLLDQPCGFSGARSLPCSHALQHLERPGPILLEHVRFCEKPARVFLDARVVSLECEFEVFSRRRYALGIDPAVAPKEIRLGRLETCHPGDQMSVPNRRVTRVGIDETLEACNRALVPALAEIG